ncbi:MAG: SoxR reducing system RseC family protein, partial [Atribacterota bacterium]
KVIRLEGEQAWVKMQKGTSCGEGNCALSGSLIDDSTSDFYTVCAKNDITAPEGSDVLVEVKDVIALQIAFMIYVLPLILVLGSYFVVKSFTPHLGIIIPVVIACVVISVLIIKRMDKRVQPNYSVIGYREEEKCNLCPFASKEKKPEKREGVFTK